MRIVILSFFSCVPHSGYRQVKAAFSFQKAPRDRKPVSGSGWPPGHRGLWWNLRGVGVQCGSACVGWAQPLGHLGAAFALSISPTPGTAKSLSVPPDYLLGHICPHKSASACTHSPAHSKYRIDDTDTCSRRPMAPVSTEVTSERARRQTSFGLRDIKVSEIQTGCRRCRRGLKK